MLSPEQLALSDAHMGSAKAKGQT